MSAWIVSKEHIDRMMAFALEEGLSVFPTEDIHYNHRLDMALDSQATTVGDILWKQNYRSVDHRYRENNLYPGYTYTPPKTKAKGPGEVAKLIACLGYQSCETDDWEKTIARRILLDFADILIRYLPGYEEAPWGAE